MPNHIINRLRITGNLNEINKLRKLVKSRHSTFDFNKIIPAPKILKNTLSGGVDSLVNFKLGLKDTFNIKTKEDYNKAILAFPAHEKTVKLGIKAYKKTGYLNWYQWNCSMWGTKWNSYENKTKLKNNALYISFDTAWSTPQPVFEKLSSIFPELTISLLYADEDLGSNFGFAEFKAGELISEGSKDLDLEQKTRIAMAIKEGSSQPKKLFEYRTGYSVNIDKECDNENFDLEEYLENLKICYTDLPKNWIEILNDNLYETN